MRAHAGDTATIKAVDIFQTLCSNTLDQLIREYETVMTIILQNTSPKYNWEKAVNIFYVLSKNYFH